jgi:predicted ATPase/DNA-binding CsgD family transcriptional regulator
MAQYNLPAQVTSFVGRTQELAEISDLLSDVDCHLLTLLGAGGTGKTRLAIAVAERQASNFADGVCFVPLQAIASSENALSTIVTELEIQVREGSVKEQFMYFLNDRQLLLVIDNFEHLLDDADLLAEINEAAPEVKLLVTSREALNLQSEWLYQVAGMHVPQGDDAIEQFSAVQLFVERARQVRRDFSLEDERKHVAQICRLVEGMPLAIEIAAAWVKRLSCAAIADEIGSNLDFLASNLRDVPDRHRSIRAVFAYSWGLLHVEEQTVFMKLSVFHGGFTREAAEAVTGASLIILSDLVDKSMLRLNPNGRYDIHELLRQYAEEKLDELHEIHRKTLDQHCEYYLKALAIPETHLLHKWKPSPQIAKFAQSEKENVLQAWRCAIDQRRLSAIQKAIAPLCFTYSWYETTDLLLQTIELLRREAPQNQQSIALGFALGVYGTAQRVAGDYQQALRHFDQSISILRSLNARQALVWALRGLGTALFMKADFRQARIVAQECHELAESLEDYGVMARAVAILAGVERLAGHYREAQSLMNLSAEYYERDVNPTEYTQLRAYEAEFFQLMGDYEQARQRMQETLPQIIETGHVWNITQQYEWIGHIEQALGNYSLAEEHLSKSLNYAYKVGDPRRIIFTLVALGDLMVGSSDIQRAYEYYQEAISRARSTSQRWQEAWAWRGLAQVAYLKGEYQAAVSWSEDSLQLCHEIGWKYGKVQNYNLRGLVAVAEHNIPIAQRYFYQAFTSGLVTETPPLILATLYGVSRMAASEGQPEQAVGFLSLILANPKSHADTRAMAQDLLDELQAELPADSFKDACVRGRNSDFEQVIDSLIAELAVQIGQIPSGASAELDEPLTKTELEILRLMDSQLSYPEIAAHRSVSLNTIKTHRSNIYSKLVASSREEAVQKARDLALI